MSYDASTVNKLVIIIILIFIVVMVIEGFMIAEANNAIWKDLLAKQKLAIYYLDDDNNKQWKLLSTNQIVVIEVENNLKDKK